MKRDAMHAGRTSRIGEGCDSVEGWRGHGWFAASVVMYACFIDGDDDDEMS
jgi:hypothetical protein